MADDFSELRRFEQDLRGAGPEVARNAVKAIKYTSMEIKKDWAQGAEASGLGNYSRSIDFDVTFAPGRITSEIGPNLGRRQGSFGFVDEGGGRVKSAPQHAGRDSWEANEDDFYRGLEIAVYDAVRKAVEE